MKDKTGSIASISASLVRLHVILVIMYVETFQTDAIVFISNMTSHRQIIFSIRDGLLILTISHSEMKG
jgi:hypothetical protein